MQSNSHLLAPFYVHKYDGIASHILSAQSERTNLGDRNARVCRFCERDHRFTTFRNKAHVIPEALGNRRLFSYYECDECNSAFGSGIETDLGSWSMPCRTISRIVGKRGVPTIKQVGVDRSWRIQYEPDGFHLTHYEDNPVFVVDEESRTIEFCLTRDPYTPVHVLKAFVKIGLGLVPDHELAAFQPARRWIMNASQTSVLAAPLAFETFMPGPMPSDVILAMVLRRRPGTRDVPYAFLVLAYGNYMYQVSIPCPERDQEVEHRRLDLPPLVAVPGLALQHGVPVVKQLQLCGQERVSGCQVRVVMSYERSESVADDASSA